MSELVAAAVQDELLILRRGKVRLHGIKVKAATQKDSAIDKLFCSNFERTAELRYYSASNKSRYLSA